MGVVGGVDVSVGECLGVCGCQCLVCWVWVGVGMSRCVWVYVGVSGCVVCAWVSGCGCM